jgi:hypothetical protein
VAGVHLTGGTVQRLPAGAGSGAEAPLDLDRLDPDRGATYVVTIQRDGTWYPSLVFTATDWILTHTERERP